MKIWLDDIREAPDGWAWIKTVKDTIATMGLIYGEVKEISLDHDLGENQPTGYDLIKWLEEKVMRQGYSFPKITVHSANLVGRANIEAAVKRIEEFLERSKK